jgi:hypothetical protein
MKDATMSDLQNLVNLIEEHFGDVVPTLVKIPKHRTRFEPKINNDNDHYTAKRDGHKIIIEMYTREPIKSERDRSRKGR